MLSTLLAIGWKFELHGIVITVVAVGTLCGSVYLLLGTNLGARLGLLVALAGLFGWMSTMGFIWWAYGIGLKGETPTWVAHDVIVNDADLSQIGIGPSSGLSDDPLERSAQNLQAMEEAGWTCLADDDPKRALAITGADAIIQTQAELLTASQYRAVRVCTKGGERSPKLFGRDELDFVAFWHKPNYAIVEVAVVEPVYAEPGRAPRRAVEDVTIQHKYTIMVRDLGDLRKNSAFIGIGSTLIFGVLCWMLHTRDKTVARHRAES